MNFQSALFKFQLPFRINTYKHRKQSKSIFLQFLYFHIEYYLNFQEI